MRRASATAACRRRRRRSAACRPRSRPARRARRPPRVAARDAAATCSACVEAQRDGGLVRERREPAQLLRADHLVAHEHVLHAAAHQRLGFADLLAALADRAGGDLQPRDRRALVRLRVRPQANAALGGERRHLVAGCARTRRGRRPARACRSRPASHRSGRGHWFIACPSFACQGGFSLSDDSAAVTPRFRALPARESLHPRSNACADR